MLTSAVAHVEGGENPLLHLPLLLRVFEELVHCIVFSIIQAFHLVPPHVQLVL